MALDAEMKDTTRAGVALQNKKAEKLPVTLLMNIRRVIYIHIAQLVLEIL